MTQATVTATGEPAVTYGRLLEAAHLSGYSFERLCDELGWLLEDDRWRQTGHSDINAFLRSIDLSPFNLGANRPQLHRRIKELQPQASNRAIAQATGTNERTVRRDTAADAAPGARNSSSDGGSGANGAANAAPTLTGREVAERARKAQKRLGRVAETEHKRRQLQTAGVEGVYRVLYADPPWQYGSRNLDEYGAAEAHYPTLSVSELCELEVAGRRVGDLTEPDAVLFLWATSPLLPEALSVMAAWGFSYKASFVWDKVRHNYGHYNSVRHELLLVGTRGSCLPDSKRLHDSVVTVERSDVHSAKPTYFRELIDELYAGARLELFAREDADGWEGWGA